MDTSFSFDVLLEFEQEGNLLEIVRTLAHITELCSMQNKIAESLLWAERTRSATESLDQLIGFSNFSISSLGVVANTFTAIGWACFVLKRHRAVVIVNRATKGKPMTKTSAGGHLLSGLFCKYKLKKP